MKNLIRSALDGAYTYAAYREHLTRLLAQGRTTGPNQSPFYLEIAQLNQARMDRLDRKARFLPETTATLTRLERDLLMLVLTEGWCGDAAQTVPVLQHLAAASPRLELRLVLRDEHPELMDHFLTEGGRSIPKLILLDPETLEVLGDWGPRPAAAQKMAMDYKHQPEPKPDYATHHLELHRWYARNKTEDAQRELIELLSPYTGAASPNTGAGV